MMTDDPGRYLYVKCLQTDLQGWLDAQAEIGATLISTQFHGEIVHVIFERPL